MEAYQEQRGLGLGHAVGMSRWLAVQAQKDAFLEIVLDDSTSKLAITWYSRFVFSLLSI
jgi:hypothetical protein